MTNTVFKDFGDYVEHFCSIHKKIAHSPERKHFVRIGQNELAQALGANIHFPAVTLEKLTVTYSDTHDNPFKTQCISMLFLDKVTDAGNFKRIEEVWSEMERLAESFVFKTKKTVYNEKTGRQKVYPALKNARITDVEMEYVENISTGFWGVMLFFDLTFPMAECVREDDFTE